MKLLLVEDEKSFAESLKDALKRDYTVDVSFTGEEALYHLAINEYDLLLIDYILPDMNGITLMEEIRRKGNDVLILFLTGNFDSKKKILALDCGADDYLLKPIDLQELQAHIRALLRRYPNRLPSDTIVLGDLTIDFAKKLVERENQMITLRKKEFELLEYFVRNAGKVLTRSIIFDHVWDSSCESVTNIIDVHINYLREKIDKPFEKKLIKTIHGIGYKLEI